MKIGVPKEIKTNERRVALTPSGAHALVQDGHQVILERGAGVGSGFEDEEYARVGAAIAPEAGAVWGEADLIVKVKEPLPEETAFFRSNQTLFTYLHLAAVPYLAEALIQSGTCSLAYETVQLPNGKLPLLTPMSEIAGKMSVQIGSHLLESYVGGRGVLLGGVPGVPPEEVVIIGGGAVGTNAAKIALGMGARVTILDLNIDRLRELDDLFEGRVTTVVSQPFYVEEAVRHADLLVGAVLVPGAKAPRIVSEAMVKQMKPGSVIVDVAIDQGGSIATMDRVTTHEHPTFVKHGVIHYAVANMPGAVPRTSTLALAHATLPYVRKLASLGLEEAIHRAPELRGGLTTYEGGIVHRVVAEALGYEARPEPFPSV
ncbi:alanine dehydrogenase [Paenibacillus thiaminolyticus]|nr:alanine dehydrogenase [Paenibacillus thiaminolyticus]